MSELERFSVPYPMIFGPGAISHLASIARKCAISRPLIVTDAGLHACGLLETAMDHLAGLRERAVVFDGVSENPREEDVLAGLELYRRTEGNGIVAFGGGSVMDAAKAIGLLAAHGGSLTDYDFLQGGLRRIVAPLPPMVAVPTTAGTGSEVSRGALVVTRRGEIVRKTLVASPNLVPTWSILDPELTTGLPPALTAGTGMDALSHCLEEILSPRYHPVVESIALGGLGRIARHLPVVFGEPENLQSRAEMQISAMMGGIGFEKGLGVVHSLSHAIGAMHPIHHGRLNATLMPPALEFNRKHCAPESLVAIANASGLSPRSADHAFRKIKAWLEELNTRFAIPARLRDLGVPESDRLEIVDRALEDHCHRSNPRRCQRDDLIELWDRAW